VECRKVQRHVHTQRPGDPLRQCVELRVRIVLARDQQRRYLEPDGRLALQVGERVEHRRELGAADVAIEALGERLQVDVRGVDPAEELLARLGAHVASSHCDGLHVGFAASLRDVDRVLHEHGRVVVGECDAGATVVPGGCGQLQWRCEIRERVHLARLAHVPVLAELAGEVAARRAEREHCRTRQEMVQRLLLDRVDAEPARTAIRI